MEKKQVKNLSILKVMIACLSLVLVSSVWMGYATTGSTPPASYQVQDETNKSFPLSAKAHVDVSAISGSVEVKAIDGDMAVVHIERRGRSRAELDCNKLLLENSPNALSVQSKTQAAPGCGQIQVSYRVLLSVPRTIDLSVQGVSGPVNIGALQGSVRLSGISGNINLDQPGGGSQVTGNNGTTTIRLGRLDASGLELSGNGGALRLYVGADLNANVKVAGHSGKVSSELPDVKVDKVGAADYFVRIGSGGPTINAVGNSGTISISRNPD